MNRLLSKAWRLLLLWGAAAVLFGVIALAWPTVTLVFLVALFAAWMLLSGAAAVVAALAHRHERGWWMVLLLGLVSLVAGIVAILYPGMTALVLVIVMGVNAIIAGVLEVAMAIRLRREIAGEWLLALAGLLSIVFGGILLFYPGAGALALLWLIGVYALAVGVLFVILAFRVRSLGQKLGVAAGSNA